VRVVPGQVLSLLALLVLKVQILTPEELRARSHACSGAQFTCFTGTKVQILTPVERPQQNVEGLGFRGQISCNETGAEA
jgi:hypothetical protein